LERERGEFGGVHGFGREKLGSITITKGVVAKRGKIGQSGQKVEGVSGGRRSEKSEVEVCTDLLLLQEERGGRESSGVLQHRRGGKRGVRGEKKLLTSNKSGWGLTRKKKKKNYDVLFGSKRGKSSRLEMWRGKGVNKATPKFRGLQLNMS